MPTPRSADQPKTRRPGAIGTAAGQGTDLHDKRVGARGGDEAISTFGIPGGMAGLEGITASKMQIIDALGGVRWNYDEKDPVARPIVKHADRVPVAVLQEGQRVVERVRFGLPARGGRLITNARDDKLAAAPMWKGLMKKGRCLTAVSYVVERDAAKQNTYRIQRRDGALMVVPGLCARRHYVFTSTGNEYDDLGHVQITAPANEFIATVHDRFLVELDTTAARDAWMDPERDPASLTRLLAPAPNERYEMVPISSDIWKREGTAEAIGEPVDWTGD